MATPDSAPGDGYIYGNLPDLSGMSLEDIRTSDDPAIVIAAFAIEADVVLKNPEDDIITD